MNIFSWAGTDLGKFVENPLIPVNKDSILFTSADFYCIEKKEGK